MTWKELMTDADNFLLTLCKIEEKVGPITGMFVPAIAPEIALANTVAAGLGSAITAHEASGGGAVQDAALAAHTLNTLVSSGVVTGGAANTLTLVANNVVEAVSGATEAMAAMAAAASGP
jgi:hypothetical protein